MSAAEILEDYFERLSPEKRRDHLQDIHQATRHMSDLMEEVLLLGRVEAGKMQFKPDALDLRDFCQRVIDSTTSATGGQCPITFTAKGVDGKASGDEALLRHIFINLLSNGVKYSRAGSPVEFTMQRRKSEAVFQIRDQGIGIPQEDLKELFQAFHRGRNVGEVQGSGLGLLIVHRCVELHGGNIKIESTVGQGTTVTVSLPLFPARAAAGVRKGSGRRSKRGRRVETRPALSPNRPRRRKAKKP
jgi:signal transduction histidine kinase